MMFDEDTQTLEEINRKLKEKQEKDKERIQKLRKNHSCKVNIDDELHLPTERKVLLLKIVGIRKQE